MEREHGDVSSSVDLNCTLDSGSNCAAEIPYAVKSIGGEITPDDVNTSLSCDDELLCPPQPPPPPELNCPLVNGVDDTTTEIVDDNITRPGNDGGALSLLDLNTCFVDNNGLRDQELEVEKLADDFRNDVVRGIVLPCVGMFFCSAEEAYRFYKEYSCRIGFGITRRSSHNFHGIKYDVTFSCNKNRPPMNFSRVEGFGKRNRGVSGTGCWAKIVVRDRSLSGKWVIEEVVIDHNHELYPDSVRLMCCHRTLPDFVKTQLEINEYAGVAQNKSFSSIFTQAGGVTRCMFTERDMRNYISEFRRLQFREGDAAALMKYFHEQQTDCPNFFYSCDIGDDGRLRNVFWADGRSRAAYKYFGDVITFDTTYLTNRYRMPFAVFVGVNHHGQSILLGCALLANEWFDTYVWLFQTFLVCMSGRPPSAIVTDQCASICGAVERVFPATRHHLCLWHIMKKFPEKLGGLKEREQILQDSHSIVYDSESEAAFETKWLAMMSSYKFGSSQKWFQNLYEIRARWVPVYVRSNFWAGMSTTQRSESMNAFFDGYVNSRTTLKMFVQKYNLALYAKWEKEKHEDFRSSYRRVRLVSNFRFESQFADAYTHRMFYVFQKEIKLLIGCSCTLSHSDGGVHKFYVHDNGASGRTFMVTFNSETAEYECECKQFEFRGIVCRHGLSVYRQVGIDLVPQKYVLSRWHRDFVRNHVKYNVALPPVFRDNDRYDYLYRSVQQIILELVEVGARDFTIGEKLLSGLAVFGQELLSSPNVVSELPIDEEPDGLVKDPEVVSSKGRPRLKCFQRHGVKKIGKSSSRGNRGQKAVTSLDLASLSACDLLKHFDGTGRS